MAKISITGDSIDLTLKLFTEDDIVDGFDNFGNNGEKFVEIVPDYWNKITFIQDAFEVFPKIEIGVLDYSFFNFVQHSGNGKSYVHIRIVSANDKSEINECFIIDDVKLANMTLEQGSFIICGSSVKSLWFQQIVQYTTEFKQIPEPLPITDIIKNIFDVGKIDFVQDDCETSNAKMEFITPGNYNIYDNLNYLFKKILAIDESDGVYCVPYNMMERKVVLTQITKKIEDYKNRILPRNKLMFPSKNNSSPTRQMLIYEPTSKTYINGSTLSYDLSADNTINTFDQMTREWDTDIKTIESSKSRLPQPIEYDEETEEQIINLPSQYIQSLDLTYKYESYSKNFLEYANLVQNFYKLMDSMNFRCAGYMNRTPGDLIEIDVKDSHKMLDSRYGGVWIISKLTSSFTRTDFIQEMTTIRSNKKPFVDTKK